jgi:hypothetical protein
MATTKHTAAQRKKLVSEYQTSGQAQNEWCKENGIGKSTLSKWLKDAIDTPMVQQTWARVQINSADSKPVLVIKIGNFKIQVDEGFSKTLLTEILEVLVTVC